MSPLVSILGVNASCVKHNPLMLENTLDEPPVEEPVAALSGVGAELQAARIEEKARIRRAEATLVAEEQLALAAGGLGSGPAPSTAPGSLESHGEGVVGEFPSLVTQGWSSLPRPALGKQVDLLGWYDDAQAQLARLKEFASYEAQKGTGRMEVRSCATDVLPRAPVPRLSCHGCPSPISFQHLRYF